MRTVTELVTTKSGIENRDREFLLAHVLRKPREWVLAHPEAPMQPAAAARYRCLLHRLEREEPLPHLLGEQWFYGRPFTVNRHVLIPRPETELLIELVLQRLRARPTPTRSPSRWEGEKKGWSASYTFSPSFEGEREGVGEPIIVDIGTGSGCIAVTLAAELPHARIIATDVSPAALRIARANAQRHGVAQRISFVSGNLLAQILSNLPTPSNSPSSQREGEKKKKLQFCILPSAFCIVANLPYLTTTEWRALPRSIRDYEPRQALDGGPDGLKHFHALFSQLKKLSTLNSQLSTFLEVDLRRKHALTALVRKTLPDWRASWHRDLARRWRVLELTAWRSY